ncbi:MAG: hypothetical protein LCH36_13475 [Actinobacteria bacterium]|nr:hypothetical protein [Actinomycetota bacterium]
MQVDQEQAQRISDAMVLEIKAEMGRRDLSSRALGRLIGKSSQYMSTRLDGGNPRTGERVALGIGDLAAIAAALDLRLGELVTRAEYAAGQSDELAARRATRPRGDERGEMLAVAHKPTQPPVHDPDAAPDYDAGDELPGDDDIA